MHISYNQPVFIYKNLYGTSGPTILKFNADYQKMCVYNSLIDTLLDANRR